MAKTTQQKDKTFSKVNLFKVFVVIIGFTVIGYLYYKHLQDVEQFKNSWNTIEGFNNNSDYRGTLSKTKSGRTCQKWTEQTPHKHTKIPDNFPNKGLGDHNYCRNPDGEDTIWCYTTDSDKRWEECDIKDSPPSNNNINKAELCRNFNDKIVGYRSLESGATFKFEKLGSDNKYYLHGPPYKVVTIDKGNSLTLKGKNENNMKDKQLFTLETKNINGGECFIFKYGDLALQYEHEHLSLRPLKADNSPFMGQCFVEYKNATEEEIDANALSIGIGIPRIGNEDLAGSGHNNLVSSGNNVVSSSTPSPTVTSNINTLGDLTQKQYSDLMKLILKDVKLYNNKVGTGKPGDENAFAIGDEALTVNVNLGGNVNEDSNDGESFTNLKGDNKSTSVKHLLDNYTKSKKGVSFLEQVQKDNNLQSVSEVLRNKFKGCPGFDRSKYYTERQIAQCKGCSPDNFLKGNL